MTNNPTIDGVSRERIAFIRSEVECGAPIDANSARDLLKVIDHQNEVALKIAPAVERQEPAEWCDPLQLKAVIQGVVARERMRPASLPDREVAESVYSAITEHLPVYEDVYDQLSEMIEPHVKRPYRIDAPLPASVVDSMGFLLKAYVAAPEVAPLQSTIAQLEDKLNKAIDLDFQRRETIARLEARVQELEEWSAMQQLIEKMTSEPAYYRIKTPRVTIGGEATEWWPAVMLYTKAQLAEHVGPYQIEEELFTAPPAPFAVPVDLHKRLNDVWLFLDGQTELNGCVWGEKPEGRHSYWWRKELRAVVEDVNACLDATAALNGVKS